MCATVPLPGTTGTEAFYRERPPLVTQLDRGSSWAAALEAWLAVTPGRTHWLQCELLQLYRHSPGKWRGVVQGNGSLNLPYGFDALAADHDMEYRCVTLCDFRTCNAQELLRRKGHLFVAVPGPFVSRAYVIYGFSSSLASTQLRLALMDPRKEARRIAKPLSEIFQPGMSRLDEFFVGWPR